MLITFTQAQFWPNISSLRIPFWLVPCGQIGKEFLRCWSQPNRKWRSASMQERALCLLCRGRKRSPWRIHASCWQLVLVLGWSTTPVAMVRWRNSPRQSLHTTSIWEGWTYWTRWLTMWQEKGPSTNFGNVFFFFIIDRMVFCSYIVYEQNSSA